MKAFTQIPCLNTERTLPLALVSIPREIDGVHEIGADYALAHGAAIMVNTDGDNQPEGGT